VTPPLGTVLYEEFPALQSARIAEDTRIEAFFKQMDADDLNRSLSYTNYQGKDCVDSFPMAISHMFNHETHHRGQVHVMLSQTPVAPPALDLHRIINP
jgi:uncharacterized damage-inducible protein DinB